LIIACWQAFEARNIKSEFAETKYIGLAVFFLSQAFLTGIPVVAITRDIPEAFYLVFSFLVFVVCMAVLSLIFVPKIIMQRAYAKLSLAEQRRKMSVRIQLSAGSYHMSGESTSNTSANHPAAAAVGGTALAQDISGTLVNRMEPDGPSRVSSYLDDELDNDDGDSDSVK
jgi:hypothetical protein